MRGRDQLRHDFVGEAAEIESMEAVSRPGQVVGVDQYIHRAGREIDDGCGMYSDRRAHSADRWRTDRRAEVWTQQYGAALGIDRVNRVVFSGDVDYVVSAWKSAGGDDHARDDERLSVDLSVERHNLKKAERGRIHVGRSENRLMPIPSRAMVIVVMGSDGELRVCEECSCKRLDDHARDEAQAAGELHGQNLRGSIAGGRTAG